MSSSETTWPTEAAQIEMVRDAFDAAFYAATSPDVGEAGLDPFEHFMAFGWKEARDPRADFSAAYYLETNRDVRETGLNPFAHWVLYGRAEGRRATPPPAEIVFGLDARELGMVRAAFDAKFYATSYADVSEARIDPFDHYMTHGWSEERDPRGDFSASYYLEANKDVRETGINPFVHWVLYGRAEGRRTMKPPAPPKARPGPRPASPGGAEGHTPRTEASAFPPRRRLRLATDARRSATEADIPGLQRDILVYELATVEKRVAQLRREVRHLEVDKAQLQRQLAALKDLIDTFARG